MHDVTLRKLTMYTFKDSLFGNDTYYWYWSKSMLILELLLLLLFLVTC